MPAIFIACVVSNAKVCPGFASADETRATKRTGMTVFFETLTTWARLEAVKTAPSAHVAPAKRKTFTLAHVGSRYAKPLAAGRGSSLACPNAAGCSLVRWR